MSKEDTARRIAVRAEIKRLIDVCEEELRNPTTLPLGAPGSITRAAWDLAQQVRQTAETNVDVKAKGAP